MFIVLVKYPIFLETKYVPARKHVFFVFYDKNNPYIGFYYRSNGINPCYRMDLSQTLGSFILFLALSIGLCQNPEPNNFRWIQGEDCALECPDAGPCMQTTLGYTLNDNPDEVLIFEDLACAILRPGHQWTYDVTWNNDAFGCDSPYGFTAMVIRDSPGLERLALQIGVDLIWVCSR